MKKHYFHPLQEKKWGPNEDKINKNYVDFSCWLETID